MTRKEISLLVARVIVGAVFATAGFIKLTEPIQNFQAHLEQYSFLPLTMIPIIARVVPWLEWLGGMFLLFGYMTRLSAFLLCLLSLGFILILSFAIFRGGGGEECGCFGKAAIVTVRQIYLLDWLTFGLGLFLASHRRYPFTLDRWFQPSSKNAS